MWLSTNRKALSDLEKKTASFRTLADPLLEEIPEL